MKKFDLLNTPLKGASLIEASAGTGKTYAITGLFLRLILEKNFAVDRILVVTYTEAATAELKERIRSRLLVTRDAIESLDEYFVDYSKTRDFSTQGLRSLVREYQQRQSLPEERVQVKNRLK